MDTHPLVRKKDLKDMRDELLEVWNTYHTQGTIPWTHETAIQDLQYQIGSLSKIFLQLKKYRYNEELSEEELMSKLADELADILSETIFIADGFGIDLSQAWDKMLDSDRNKIAKRSSDTKTVQM